MDPQPVEVLSHDTWWPGALHEWQRIGDAWWGLLSYQIALEMPDAHGSPCVIREARRMWQHQFTFRRAVGSGAPAVAKEEVGDADDHGDEQPEP